MIEPGEVKKYYEWKDGFRQGTVECYLCEAEEKIYFESGRFVDKNRLDDDLFTISEEIYTQKTQREEALINQQQEWASLLGNEDQALLNQVTQSSTPQPAPQPAPVVEKSPIRIILEKQKKKEVKQVNITLNIEVPTEKVIDLLTVMFDEDEVYEEIISEAVSNFDIEDLRNLIQESIIKSIKESQDE